MSKLIHTSFGLTAGSFLGWFLIKVIGRTVRIKIIGMEKLIPYLENEKPCIGALWHGRHFLLVDQFRRKLPNRNKIGVLASRSRDGELLARILKKFNYHVIRGSSSKAAVSGFMELVGIMREGYDTIIAVDGPKGPGEKAKAGVILLAQKTGYPIIPLSSSVKRYWKINSWDNYLIPKPFTTGVITIGEPIMVPSDFKREKMELIRNLLEKKLSEITLQADNYFHQKR